MLKKVAKWVLLTVGGLLCIVLVFYVVIYFKTESTINKTYQVKTQPISIPNDSASYMRGKKIATNRGCMGCHGIELAGGEAFFDEHNPLGVLYASNITSGNGGIQYADSDWIKVLRHGVHKENKSVWLMPSQDLYQISNQDMKDLLCYVKSFPPVDNVVPAKSIKPLGRVLLFLDKIPFLSAEMINHNAVIADSVPAVASAEYGHYLATTCQGCHGSKLTGAPSHEPGAIAPPNITATGEVGKWTVNNFMGVFHNGTTPQGRKLDKGMPWDKFSYSDTDLKGIYLYLQSLK